MPTVALQQAFARAQQLHQARKLGEAEKIYREILAADPRHSEALHYLGVIAHQVGRDDLAIEWIRRAIALNPNHFAAHYNLGEACHSAGHMDEALTAFRRAVELKPDQPDAYNNIGVVLTQREEFDAAITSFQHALRLKPDFAVARSNLGNAWKSKGQWSEALAAYRIALQLSPGYVEARSNLAIALAERGQVDEAIAEFRRVIALRPDDAEAHKNLGIALVEQGSLDEAMAEYLTALRLRPDYAEVHNTLGNALNERLKLDEAIAEFRRAIELKPALVEPHNNLAFALKNDGQWREAVAEYRCALQLQPNNAKVHSSLVYSLQFCPGKDDDILVEEQARWDARFGAPLRPFIRSHDNTPDPEKRLRIGYVSPDFRSHPVSFFFLPLAEAHDREQVEVYCYADGRRWDEVTDRVRKTATVWRDVRGIQDALLAEQMRADGIDILVDLAMHTAGNRLIAFARKPAPVQASWLAYAGTTGLEAMDYRITDGCIDPPEVERAIAVEQPVRLPDAWCCYAPIKEFPPVNPLPAEQTGAVTFGSLNQFSKLSEELLQCWARLLAMVPRSRLLMICPESKARERTRAIFSACGISPERVEFLALCPWRDYARLFSRIDLALDAYPCNGMTTTCHSLWMGVPVVTRAGSRAISRAGSSLLHTIGLEEWVAQSEDDYLRIASDWAKDLPSLAALRSALRGRMQASPLMDAPRFARNLEAAYRTMWRRWCGNR